MRVWATTAWLFALSCGAQAQSGGEGPLLRRGAALEERSEFTQAKSLYLDGLREFPRSSEMAFRIGTLYLRESKWPEAIEYLQKSSDLRPRDADTFYYLGQAYYLDGQIGPARRAILRAVTLAPDRPELAQKYGEYLCEDAVCTEGLRFLLKARSLDATLPSIDFDLGMAYHKLAQVPEAQRYLEVAFKKDPRNLSAARFLADVFGRQGQWVRAKELYQIVLAAEPRNAWALYGLGRALIALGDHEGALNPLRAAVAVEPAIAEAHFQLATALRQLGRPEEAARELKLFKALRDRTEGAAPAVSFKQTAVERRIWEACGRFLDENKEAEALGYLDSLSAERAVKSHYLVGALYFNRGRPADAVRLLLRAAESSPSDADVLAFLGRAQVAAGDSGAAQETLDRARALQPKAELPLVGLGELAYARGDWKQAIAYFEQSRTAQVPVLLELCRSYLRAHDQAKALETAELIRAFGSGDAVSLQKLASLLADEQASTDPASSPP